MKKIYLFALTALVALLIAAQTKKETPKKTIEFQKGNWSQIVEKAKMEQKPIFVFVHATWCGYCKKMEAKTFTDSLVGETYNKKYLNVSLDGEQGEGIDFVKKYQIKGYPVLLYFNPDGTLAKMVEGYKTKDEMIALSK